MKPFMSEGFLLGNIYSSKIYNEIKDLPIIDYHCHIDAKEIYENRVFGNITEVWLGGDHYKWRAMRNMGVKEDLITGKKSTDKEKFIAWAGVMPYLAGHPLFHFSQLELKRYFHIDAALTPKTADEIYEKANAVLAGLPVRDIINQSNVEVICTTNDPLDDLRYHKLIAKDASFDVKVIPAFRPDKALNIENAGFATYANELGTLCSRGITTVEDMKACILERLDYFVENGARASDHGIFDVPFVNNPKQLANIALKKALLGDTPTKEECDAYRTYMLLFLGKAYSERNMVMEIHFGCARNINGEMFKRLGADTGFDSIHGSTGATNIAPLLNAMLENEGLPKTVIFSLNPADNEVITSVQGAFNKAGIKGRVQQGAAWWFNDHKEGIIAQIKNYAASAPLDSFIGMLTDSRSFLSYARHEYFRRILADYLGTLVENGEYPADSLEYLIDIAKNIAYYNAKNYLGLTEK